MEHPVEEFWRTLQGFDDYPPDVTRVPELLPGTAAFAASAGLYRPPGSRELPAFPYDGLMIVAHNLDSEKGYRVRWDSGVSHGDRVPGTRLMSTWAGLYRLLSLAELELKDFFFTNIFVGLKKGEATGPFTAHPAPTFRRWCRDFLAHQIATMRPRVMLILGTPATTDIAGVTDPLPWPAGKLPAPGVFRARVAGVDTLLVPAHHTSYQKRINADAASLRAAWATKL